MEDEWGFTATGEESKKEWAFELSKIFDSAPTINLGPHKEDVSLASNRTDTSINTNQSTKKNDEEEKDQEQDNKKGEGSTSDQTNNGDNDTSAEQQTSESDENE